MNKKVCEKKLRKITKKLLDEEQLIKTKEERQQVLIEELKKNLKENIRKKYEDELKYINNQENIKKLVDYNHTSNFLMKFDPNEDRVLAMGINPGGGQHFYDINEEDFVQSHIYFTYTTNDMTEEEKISLEILDGNYVFKHNYHKSNYELFEKIDARAHWCQEDYFKKDELKKILKNSELFTEGGYTYNEKDLENITSALRKMQQAERNQHKGPYVFFSDLIWYGDGNQSNIKKALEKSFNDNQEKFYESIRETIRLNIEYYKPKIIVITNAYASDLISDALKNSKRKDFIDYKDKDKETPIIFSGMVSGRRQLDKYSLYRLKDRIKEIYYKKRG